MASQCDHIEHVRTQLPYALLAGGVALLFGALPAGFGVPWWVSLGGSAALLIGIVRWKGKTV
jgi:Na+/H+ antiporter NhaC